MCAHHTINRVTLYIIIHLPYLYMSRGKVSFGWICAKLWCRHQRRRVLTRHKFGTDRVARRRHPRLYDICIYIPV